MMVCDMNGRNMTFLVQWVGGFFVAGRPAIGFYDKAFMGIGGPRIAMMREIQSVLRRALPWYRGQFPE